MYKNLTLQFILLAFLSCSNYLFGQGGGNGGDGGDMLFVRANWLDKKGNWVSFTGGISQNGNGNSDPNPSDPGDGTNPFMCIYPGGDNIINIRLEVNFASNNFMNTEDVYLRYNFGNIATTHSDIHIQDSDLQFNQDLGVFTFTELIIVDVASYCPTDEILSFPVSYSLRNESGGLFPVNEYNSASQIFSFTIFGTSLPTPSYSMEKTLCCSDDTDVNGNPLAAISNNFGVQNLNSFQVSDISSKNMDLDQFDYFNQNQASSKYLIYPNPFNSVLHFDPTSLIEGNEVNKIEEIVITDITGKIHWQTQAVNEFLRNIKTENWQTGTYFVRVKSENNLKVIKLIKI